MIPEAPRGLHHLTPSDTITEGGSWPAGNGHFGTCLFFLMVESFLKTFSGGLNKTNFTILTCPNLNPPGHIDYSSQLDVRSSLPHCFSVARMHEIYIQYRLFAFVLLR